MDYKAAAEWYKKSEAKKSWLGVHGMGLLHLNGQGVPVDYKKAYSVCSFPQKVLSIRVPSQNFERTATAGHSESQYYLGLMLFNGLGVDRDYRKAIQQFTLAAQQGHLLAMYNLGLMHSTGTGVSRSCDVWMLVIILFGEFITLQIAVGFFKNVAERGEWNRLFGAAYEEYEVGPITPTCLPSSFLSTRAVILMPRS